MLKGWLRRLLGRSVTRGQRVEKRKVGPWVRPSLEGLEDRVLLSGTPDLMALAVHVGVEAWQGATAYLAPLDPALRNAGLPYGIAVYQPTTNAIIWANVARIGWTRAAVEDVLHPSDDHIQPRPTVEQSGPQQDPAAWFPHISAVYQWALANSADLPNGGTILQQSSAQSLYDVLYAYREALQSQLIANPHLSANANANAGDLTYASMDWSDPNAVYNALFAWERAFGAPLDQRLFWAGYNYAVTRKDGYDPNFLSAQQAYDWNSANPDSPEQMSVPIGLLDFYYLDSIVRWFHGGGTEMAVRAWDSAAKSQIYSLDNQAEKNPNHQNVPPWYWAIKAWDQTAGDPIGVRIAWAGEQITNTRYNHYGGNGDDLLLAGVSDPSTDDEGWFGYDTDLSTRKGGTVTPGERTKEAFEVLVIPIVSLVTDILGAGGVIGDELGLIIYGAELAAGTFQDFYPSSGSSTSPPAPTFQPHPGWTTLGNAVYEYAWAVHAWREAFAPSEVHLPK